ncbi:hypothetical protein HHI36_022179 [Cryptolaemus montrouzieri]|uniref:Uncharacterized protein n=1 Tax=Cryptolaemus montrouzieri TaxID=559131 RepID=A0ABD2MZW9_9CUCU
MWKEKNKSKNKANSLVDRQTENKSQKTTSRLEERILTLENYVCGAERLGKNQKRGEKSGGIGENQDMDRIIDTEVEEATTNIKAGKVSGSDNIDPETIKWRGKK